MKAAVGHQQDIQNASVGIELEHFANSKQISSLTIHNYKVI